MTYSDSEITAGEISHILFYVNSHLLAIHLYFDKSFATVIPGHAEKTFHTLMKLKMKVLMDIKALTLSVDSATSDEYSITHMPDYFNVWWKEYLGSCGVLGILLKSSVQDVMELVEGYFSELLDHVKTCLLLDMLKLSPVLILETIGLTSLEQCHQTTIDRELLEILQERMMNFICSSDRLGLGLKPRAGPGLERARARQYTGPSPDNGLGLG
ncbi:hypothetical protein EV424DRAFT_1351624 [Suillus variegatus]|nr:hypothetical protein EV424DRAFT_1351624 [Suillus variegatus]